MSFRRLGEMLRPFQEFIIAFLVAVLSDEALRATASVIVNATEISIRLFTELIGTSFVQGILYITQHFILGIINIFSPVSPALVTTLVVLLYSFVLVKGILRVSSPDPNDPTKSLLYREVIRDTIDDFDKALGNLKREERLAIRGIAIALGLVTGLVLILGSRDTRLSHISLLLSLAAGYVFYKHIEPRYVAMKSRERIESGNNLLENVYLKRLQRFGSLSPEFKSTATFIFSSLIIYVFQLESRNRKFERIYVPKEVRWEGGKLKAEYVRVYPPNEIGIIEVEATPTPKIRTGTTNRNAVLEVRTTINDDIDSEWNNVKFELSLEDVHGNIWRAFLINESDFSFGIVAFFAPGATEILCKPGLKVRPYLEPKFDSDVHGLIERFLPSYVVKDLDKHLKGTGFSNLKPRLVDLSKDVSNDFISISFAVTTARDEFLIHKSPDYVFGPSYERSIRDVIEPHLFKLSFHFTCNSVTPEGPLQEIRKGGVINLLPLPNPVGTDLIVVTKDGYILFQYRSGGATLAAERGNFAHAISGGLDFSTVKNVISKYEGRAQYENCNDFLEELSRQEEGEEEEVSISDEEIGRATLAISITRNALYLGLPGFFGFKRYDEDWNNVKERRDALIQLGLESRNVLAVKLPETIAPSKVTNEFLESLIKNWILYVFRYSATKDEAIVNDFEERIDVIERGGKEVSADARKSVTKSFLNYNNYSAILAVSILSLLQYYYCNKMGWKEISEVGAK